MNPVIKVVLKVVGVWVAVYTVCFLTGVPRSAANGIGIAVTVLLVLTSYKKLMDN